MVTQFHFEKIYEIFNTINTKTLVLRLLIWFRAGPGSITENKSPWHKEIMPCYKSDMFEMKKQIN